MVVSDEFLTEVLSTVSQRTGASREAAERIVLQYFPRRNYLTKPEAARFLCVCERSIDKARNNGLKWVKMGKQILFTVEDLKAYAAANTHSGPDSVPCLAEK